MAIETTRSPEGAPSGRWRVVSERSRVGFRVKKMALYHVKGRFTGVAGTVELGPGAASSAAAASRVIR